MDLELVLLHLEEERLDEAEHALHPEEAVGRGDFDVLAIG